MGFPVFARDNPVGGSAPVPGILTLAISYFFSVKSSGQTFSPQPRPQLPAIHDGIAVLGWNPDSFFSISLSQSFPHTHPLRVDCIRGGVVESLAT